MNPPQKYKFGFDAYGLLLFLLIMLPNIIWFTTPAPNDILRQPTTTPTLDTIGMAFQILMIAALCCIVRKNNQPLKLTPLLIATAAFTLTYWAGWITYYRGIATLPIILILTLAPCLAFICHSINRRNLPATILSTTFATCHILSSLYRLKA